MIELGRLNEASSAIETAIKLAPGDIRSYYSLAQSKRLAPGDPHIRAMEELARDMPSLDHGRANRPEFRLGQGICGHRGSPTFVSSPAGRQRIEAETNGLRRAAPLWAIRTHAGGVHQRADARQRRRRRALLRSGVHSRDAALREPPWSSRSWPATPRSSAPARSMTSVGPYWRLGGAAAGALTCPEVVSLMSGEQLRQLGASYVGRIRAAAPAAERITDKMPENFRFAGLIHLALPNARIIHTRRDPIDTCLSCFSKRFLRTICLIPTTSANWAAITAPTRR